MKIRYTFALIPCLLAAPLQAQQTAGAPVSLTLGDIVDTRSNGQYFGNLHVELKLNGDLIFDAYGIGKPIITSAKDNTGRSLLKDKQDYSLLWDLQTRQQQQSANESVTAELANPSRNATSFSMEGSIPVYAPARDLSSVVVLPDLRPIYGKPLDSKETGISFTVFNKQYSEKDRKPASGGVDSDKLPAPSISLRDNDLQFRIKDPRKLLVRIEVIGQDGGLIETRSKSKMSADGVDTYTYSFEQQLPVGVGLKLYYATAKAISYVPFKLDQIPLP